MQQEWRNCLKKFEEIHKIIKSAKTAAIVGHMRPDGDCVGSCVAMRLALLSIGYDIADIYIDGAVTSTFDYMAECKNIITKLFDDPESKKYDLMIILDCGDEGRLGVFSGLRAYCKNVICVDHHQNNSVEANVTLVETQYPSVGAILYEYFREYDVKITKDIATALYTSIASDTGCFLFSNTTAQSHRIAADLMEHGINMEEINYYNFRVYDAQNIGILIYVLKNIKLYANKQIAVVCLPYSVIKKLSIDNDFRHRFQKYAEDIEGVRASVCLSERERGVFHVSLRSHGETNVAQVAEHFGGGGHRNAAGFQKNGNYKQLLKEVIDKLEKALK